MSEEKFNISIFRNGDLIVTRGGRKIRIQQCSSSEENKGQSLSEIILECQKLAEAWYDEEHIRRAQTEPDSQVFHGKAYMSRRAHAILDEDKKKYLKNLMKTRRYRRVEETIVENLPAKKKRREEVCEGCQIEAPGQRDHQGPGGCLNGSSSL